MKHRNLDVEVGHWSPAVIDSILERGGASDIIALLTALRHEPRGAAAMAALATAERWDVYGYPNLIRACLEKWRNEAREDRLGSGPASGG